ncbi:MAG: CapA family protein [Betaproteobacteria bacterium]|nr:CapA family protein [Betaproteobacteria bacterium]
MSQPFEASGGGTSDITLFLCGDVMTGRAIDQILTFPNKPHLFEPYMRSALGYVDPAEQATGRIKRPVNFAYIWGDALAEFERARPDVRIINLETAVTAAEDAWPGKGIHYRMHPANVPCLTAARIDCCVLATKRPRDVVVISFHWGSNWGFDIPREHRAFAHHLIDAAGVDIVHGHSSHHPRGIELYHDKLILHGCGDLLNDYEGIGGYDAYRGELALMYFPTVDAATGRLLRLVMTPTRTRHLRVNRAPQEAVDWLGKTLDREGNKFGTRVERQADNTFLLRWGERAAVRLP